MLPDYDWSAFRQLTAGVTALASGEDEAGLELAPVLRRALAMLYAAGATMPDAFEMLDATDGTPFMLDADLEQSVLESDVATHDPLATEDFAGRLSESIAGLQPDFDANEPDEYVLTIAESVGAALARLGTGADLYDAGNRERAGWEWSFGFDDWGADILTALAALHELLWGAGE